MFCSEQKVKYNFIIVIQQDCHFLCPHIWLTTITRLPSWLSCKESACNTGAARDTGSFPGLERSLKKEMATHSSILTCRIPWTEEPGRLSMRSKGVGYNWRGLAHTLPQGMTYLTYTEYVMWNAGLDDLQAGIKIVGEISTTSDMQVYHNCRKWGETKEPLKEGENGKWKCWLKNATFKKLRSWHLVPPLHGK